MTNQKHPMFPTKEQLAEWYLEHFEENKNFDAMMIKAFQAGADQELEACCDWLDYADEKEKLRACRRPKSLSLKKKALQALDSLCVNHTHENIIIRRALASLPD